MVESTAKLREEIMALSGVDIMENANEFKSTYKIMDELAAKWEDLSDIQQASITELIAGKRQGNIVSSLMSNFDTARDALETSLNSSGSAMREHEKWQQSLEAQINSLKASWQGLSQAFLSSDFLKVAFNGVINLVDGLTKLIDTLGAFPVLTSTIAATLSGFKNIGIFKTIDSDLVGFTNHIGIANKSFAEMAAAFKSAKTTNDIKGFWSGLKEMTSTVVTGLSSFDRNAIAEYNKLVQQGGATQEQLADAMKGTSVAAQNLAAAANGTEIQLQGVQSGGIGAALGLTAAKVAAIAFNAALTMGISLAIQFVMEGLMAIFNASDNLAEKVDELTSKFEQEHDALTKLKDDYDTTNEDSMISKYEKLSKGVDNLGRNVSLTADEYSEYQDIVNTIADQIPSLVSGYDEQGNALLSCKGNVEELTVAYEKLIHAQNQSILSQNSADIEKNWQNTLKQANGYDLGEAIGNALSFDGGFGGSLEVWDMKTDTAKWLSSLTSNTSEEKIKKFMDSNTAASWELTQALQGAGFDVNGWTSTKKLSQVIKDALNEEPEKIKGILDNYYAQFDDAVAEYKTKATALLSEAFDISSSISGLNYGNISEELQSIAYQIVNSLDFDFLSNLTEQGITIDKWTKELLNQLNSISKDGNAKIETAFNLKTQFNDGEVTYGEYAKGIQEAKNIINELELDDEIKQQIKLSFDDKEIQTQYNVMSQFLAKKVTKGNEYWQIQDIQHFLNDLTVDELAAVVDIRTEIDWENTSAKDIRKQIEDRVKLNEALKFEASIEVDKTALEALNTALEESASAMGLSEESIDSLKAKYSDLEGYNPHTLFEKTANGVKVNREELAKLEKKYNDLTKTEVQEHLDTLVEEYNKCTKAIDGNIGSQEKLELISKREKYAQQIEELAEYQLQLEGVTGAYQRWIDAQNTPEDYEGYQAVATSREDIEDEISRGFLSNSTKEYIDLLSGKDLVGGSIDDYYNAWKRLDQKVGSTSYSINDFFTVNDDGDITSTGIDRFFKGLQQDFKGSVAEFNKETGQWEYDFSQENLQKIQDEWGLGIEAIELLLEAAAAAGYDVDWGGIFDDLDLDTSNFESLVSVAEQAQKELNKLEGYEDLDFNFSTTTVEAATSELEKAQKTYNELVTGDDGKININAEGADNARVILATLLVQKQQLEDSEIAINISTSGLDDSQAKAVAWVQDFRTKYKNLEIAISTGEGIEEAKTELETVKTSLGELDGDTAKIAAQLVLGEDTDTDGAGFKTQVNNAIDSVGKQDINVGFKLDETAISDLNSQLLTNFTVDATAKITNIDKSQLEAVETSGTVNWTENTDGVSKSFEADGTVNWNDDVKNVKTSFSASGTVKWTSGNNVKVKVISEANGTANANGTAQSGRAFARGDWGIKGSGTALVGELGMETLVRGGKFFTIGDNGAEFIKYQQGDIIFNHKQTEELFKNGKVTSDGGRGRMFVNGSAFAEGTALWQATASGSKFASNRWASTKDGISVSPSKSTKKNAVKKKKVSVNTTVTEDDDSTSVNTNTSYATVNGTDFSDKNQQKLGTEKEAEKFEETFDWVAVAIERIEREIDNLDQRVGNVYQSWGSRNASLTDEISKVGKEIDLQVSAAKAYLGKAKSVGLTEKDSSGRSYAELIQEGALSIEDFEGEGNEALVEKIKEYQKWYDLYLGCVDAVNELQETESKLYEQRFENVQSQYDGILQGFEHTESMLNEYISQAEAKGYIVSEKYYNALIANEKSNIEELKKEQSALIKARDEAEKNGIGKNSESYANMCAEIDSVTQAIESGNTALIEYANSIRDIDWQVFDLIQERISDVTAEADFLIDLMSNKKLFDDNGKMTDKGLATMGLHGQNYNTYMYQADEYKKEIAELDKQLKSDPYDQELINRRRELLELQRESILNAEQEKQSIKDLVEEAYDAELNALEEKISLYQESLDSQKD